jgi:hypothetical protein
MENFEYIKPFDRSYWVQPGKFLAGFYPGSPINTHAKEKVRALLDCGVRCIISLIDEKDVDQDQKPLMPYSHHIRALAADYNIDTSYIRIPIPDLDITNTPSMKIILNTIDNAILNDMPVYLHCLGGIGRTGTVVACWLIRHGLASIDNFLDVIRSMREEWKDPMAMWDSPETYEQQEFVWHWKRGM